MGMHVKFPEARELIERCIRARLVPNLVGSPGLGKSALIHQIAETYNLLVIDLRLSQCDPVDLMGFPHIYQDRNKAGYVPMTTFPIEGDELPINPKTGQPYSGWLLFLDEANGAEPAVQKAAYKLILDRMVGEFKLHKNVAIVCAGNLETDGALVEEQSTAMQSRMVHMTLELDVPAWLEWARENGIDYRITSYIQWRPEELQRFDPSHEDVTFACPRTWEFASRLISGIEQLIILDKTLLSGTISEGVAREFYGFTKIFEDLPTLESIVKSPNSVPVPTEPSVCWALTGSLGQHATEKNIEPIMQFISRIPKEFQVVALREICRRNKKLKTSAPVLDWVTQNSHELF